MKKMMFEEFTQMIADKIKEFLPKNFENAQIELRIVTKNNDLTLTGITINTGETNIAPTIYLDSFYKQYKDGRSVEDILRVIAETRIKHDVSENFDTGFITNIKKCRNKIVPRLINADMNPVLLSQRPHKILADLAVTYAIVLGKDSNGAMSIPITNEIFSTWEITLDDLHDIAIDNIPLIEPSSFISMSAMMSEMMMPQILNECDGDEDRAKEVIDQMIPLDDKMYVLTNQTKLNGAAALLDRHMMDKILQRLGEDIYILPASLHEVIIVRGMGMSVDDLEAMVCEVNASQVQMEERLSNHVYRYSATEGLSIAS